jgi:hypothetical protein
MARQVGYDSEILKAVESVNNTQKSILISKVKSTSAMICMARPSQSGDWHSNPKQTTCVKPLP